MVIIKSMEEFGRAWDDKGAGDALQFQDYAGKWHPFGGFKGTAAFIQHLIDEAQLRIWEPEDAQD